MCALVPENPKELTPARRGLPLVCHGIASSTTRTGRRSHGMCGDGVLEMQVLRQHFVLQRKHDLDQAGDPGRRLEVPDVGLHRSDQQRPVRVPIGPVDRRGGLDLDGVTKRCARSRAPPGNRRRGRHIRHEQRCGDNRCWAPPLGTVNAPEAPS